MHSHHNHDDDPRHLDHETRDNDVDHWPYLNDVRAAVNHFAANDNDPNVHVVIANLRAVYDAAAAVLDTDNTPQPADDSTLDALRAAYIDAHCLLNAVDDLAYLRANQPQFYAARDALVAHLRDAASDRLG